MITTARVYDSDIHGDAEETMRNLAASIALMYAGNWDAMIGWKQHCSQARPLRTQDIRTILNMTLSDVTQASWHAEIRSHLVRFQAPQPEPRPRLHVVRDPAPKPKRAWFVRVRARFRDDVFVPDHPMGKAHLVDHGRTFVEWNIPPNPFGQHEDDPKVPKLVVFGWCGKRYNNPVMLDGDLADEILCAGCRRQRDTVAKPPSEIRTCR